MSNGELITISNVTLQRKLLMLFYIAKALVCSFTESQVGITTEEDL